jgi:hypothetical protein
VARCTHYSSHSDLASHSTSSPAESRRGCAGVVITVPLAHRGPWLIQARRHEIVGKTNMPICEFDFSAESASSPSLALHHATTQHVSVSIVPANPASVSVPLCSVSRARPARNDQISITLAVNIFGFCPEIFLSTSSSHCLRLISSFVVAVIEQADTFTCLLCWISLCPICVPMRVAKYVHRF